MTEIFNILYDFYRLPEDQEFFSSEKDMMRALYAKVNVRRLGRPGLPLVTRPSCPVAAAWSASVIVTVPYVPSRPVRLQKDTYVACLTGV